MLLISAEDYLRPSRSFKDELLEFHEVVNIKPVTWCDHSCGIIHSFEWRNFITNKHGGPRFGVVLLHMRPLRATTTQVDAAASGGIGSLIKKFEEELQVS